MNLFYVFFEGELGFNCMHYVLKTVLVKMRGSSGEAKWS